MLLVNADNVVQQANEAAAQLFGYTRAALHQLPGSALVAPVRCTSKKTLPDKC